jgi:hypothetical protein
MGPHVIRHTLICKLDVSTNNFDLLLFYGFLTNLYLRQLRNCLDLSIFMCDLCF